MTRQLVGRVLVVVGIVLVLLSALADVIGIGGSDMFGWRQIVGIVVGAVVAVAGLFLAMRQPKAAPSVAEPE